MKKTDIIDNVKTALEEEFLKVAETPKEEFLAMLNDGERIQTFPLHSKEFSLAFRLFYQKNYNSDLNSSNMQEILYYLEAKAYENKLDFELVNRIYNIDNQQIIYDLNKDTGMAVFIEKGKCSIALLDDWLFKRSSIFKNQVCPNLSKSIEPKKLPKYIEKHFNLKSKNEIKLFSMYLVSCFWGLNISHPALFLSAEQGSGKSTFLRKLERLVDPKSIDLAGIPYSKDGLELRFSNSYFVALDNLSNISRATSDLIARAITGGTNTKRALYENLKEICINIKCVLALNSVSMIIKEPDLLDRMFILYLARFKNSENRAEIEVLDEFEEDLPNILGCCFKCLAIALNDKEPIPPVEKIRLADYQDCCIRIGKVLGYSPEEVTQLLFMNQKRIDREAINENISAQCLIAFMKTRESYEDSVTNLLHDLKKVAARKFINAYLLPNSANHLSRQLNKVKSNLEHEYNIVYHIRNAGDCRMIKVNKIRKITDNTDND